MTTQIQSQPFSLFTEYDIFLFKQGNHFKLYEKLGSHITNYQNQQGVYFSVYAPNASSVFVIGNFNFWNTQSAPLYPRFDNSGIWEAFIPQVQEGELYKYFITNGQSGQTFEKIDPFAFSFELPPRTASIVKTIDKHQWKDKKWLEKRKTNHLNKAISVYEMHLGSWKKKHNEQGEHSLTYTEFADDLVTYLKQLNFTHVEFMPLTEHPYYLSWGYQSLGFFAPTSRYGQPEELMFLIDKLHEANIGVILDFVPSHFPCDAHGLYQYDGGAVYEYAHPLKQIHPDWKSANFDLEKPQVMSFLISSALFWLEQYHIDGLRIDAVASMLYLDYSRQYNQWLPNHHGGNENLEAIAFIKKMNETIFGIYPDVHVIAEESTAWYGVSKPTYQGGLGFDMKWMMGWMHDVLGYLKLQPIHRKYHHHELTFSFSYVNNENFMLPLSHDEVAHGKGSLLSRMPGDDWQQFANLRLLYSFMYAHPGSKLLFMGGEFGQGKEWNINASLDWHLLDLPQHKGIQKLIQQLNALYQKESALYELQFQPAGFVPIDMSNHEQSILVFYRTSSSGEKIIIVGNFTPEVRYDFCIGIPEAGSYKQIFNSDEIQYYGSGIDNQNPIPSKPIAFHHHQNSISIHVPPLAFLYFKKTNS